MAIVDDELKVLGEQRPGIEPVPLFADFSGNAELGFAFLRYSPTSQLLPRRKRNSKRLNSPLDVVEMRNQERQVNGMGKRDSERPDFTALEGRSELSRSGRGIAALLEQRMHA